MICGFLDPKGKMHPCCKWEHVSKARELVEKYSSQLHRPDKYEFCEDVLLKNGWICFRPGDVYKGIYDHDGKVQFITEEQMGFLEKNRHEFNLHQTADIEKMLRDFGDLHRWRSDNKKEFCEDVLLKNGWICFRPGDVYKGIYDHDGKVQFITEEQMGFLEKNRHEFNLHQTADIEKMLRDFGDLHRWRSDNKKENLE